MKFWWYFCGLLIIANTALMFWPTSASRAAHIHGQRSEVNPHFIRLNKEIEDRFNGSEIPIGGEGDLNIVEQNGAQCYRLGPFMHRSNYELAEAVLFNANIDYRRSKRESRRSEVYRIYLGPFPTQAEALDKRTELRSRNILDHFVRKQENGDFIVSLGIYTTQESADNAVKLFDGALETVKMSQEDLVLPDSYWLHFAIGDDDPLKQQLKLMDWGEQSAKFGNYRCQEAG